MPETDQPAMTPIVAFYSGSGKDNRGRTLAEIQAFSMAQLENTHDYIQWLFPLRERSGSNRNAPILTDDDVSIMKNDPIIKNNIINSYELMLDFYGFVQKVDEDINLVYPAMSLNFAERSAFWLTRYNHNFLRITRILKCLRIMGLTVQQAMFYEALADVYKKSEYGRIIGEETWGYWERAVSG